MLRATVIFLAILICVQAAFSQITRDAALMLSPVFPGTGPSAAELSWTPAGSPDSAVLSTTLVRQGLTTSEKLFFPGSQWMTLIPGNDPTIEQEILQTVGFDSLRYLASGYVRSGRGRSARDLPRRVVAVVIDQDAEPEVRPELSRLVDDLTREGWHVWTLIVSPTTSVPDLKRDIRRVWLESAQRFDPPMHVLLIGDLPYASSGGFSTSGATPNPDFHPEHGGAWASDAYYADMETSPGVDAEYQWTDQFVSISDRTVADRKENQNTPGDGKFDQTILPSDLELCVGRVDMRDLPAFGTDPSDRTAELLLIRRYLNKNHAYRTRTFEAPMRAVVDDNFGPFTRSNDEYRVTEAFAASGWRSFAPIVGSANVIEGDWIPDRSNDRFSLDTAEALLAYGCGGGGYDHCDFVTNTTELTQTPLYAVFTLMFGSYFGDVHSTNNVMRAALANAGWILTAGWSGRPHWFLHPLANGNTIGECQQLSANNNGQYLGSVYEELETGAFGPLLLGERNIHILLLGDPTLTLQSPVIPGELTAEPSTSAPRSVSLQWLRSPQHGGPSGATVAYLIESGRADVGITNLIDTLAPSDQEVLEITVTLPPGDHLIRVRPYFTAQDRLAPLPGRGVIANVPVLSVDSTPRDDTEPAVWTIMDVMGRTVAGRHGTLRDVHRYLEDSGCPAGVYAVSSGTQRLLVNISR